jgi:tetratricopeptide (TPR) repeat protein
VACLDENTIAALVGGDLSETRLAEVHAHLEGCSECSRLVAALVKGARDDEERLSIADTAPASGPTGLVADEPRLERVGRYLVLEHLGTGGMGRVHAAFDPVLERKVALKLVKSGRTPSAAEEVKARLLREGKSIAQLNHPNIVSIFDMGVSEGEVYVAMELVDGGSLKGWLAAKPRAWREVLAVYLDAGRGLAAAHRAGLVHRDFKPENVLIGADGRVRVSDFGLSTSVTARDEARPALPTDSRLTQTGAVLGTPAYMSPEQWEGRQADALSDQFSFCLALWEGLYGARPFERTQGRPSWRRVEPTSGQGVPATVRAALERGLSIEPRARFASMEALLSVLEPRAGQRWALVAAAVLLLVGGGAFGAWRSSQRCTGAPALAAAVWSPQQAVSIDRALASEPGAAALVRSRLSSYMAAWTAMHTEACEATRVRGEQSDQVLTVRMACLERRRAEVRALVDVFSAASKPEQVQAAPEAVEALPPLSLCANAEGLLAQVAPPARAELVPVVEAVRDELAQARVLMELGRFDEAVAVVSKAREHATATGYAPVQAEALAVEGALDEKRGELKAAEKVLLEAIATAEGARHDLARAEAATTLVLVLGVRQSRAADAAPWDKLAEGAIARVGGGPWLEARLLQTRGLVRYAEGKLPEAIELQQRAADAFSTLDPDGVQRALALNELGAAYRGARKAPEATAAYEQALAIFRARLGDQSDAAAASRNGLANTYMLDGKFEEAQALYASALAVFEKRLGPKHFRTVTAYNNLGVVLTEQGRFADALPYFEKVVAAREAPAADPKAADAHANLGMLLLELGRLEDAQRELERAKALLQGVAIDHFSNAEVLLGFARLALERKQGVEAAPLLARVRELCAGKQGFRFDYTRARADFLQARVLVEAQGRRDEGRALALQVKTSLEGFGASRFRRDLSVVQQWLDAR